MSAPLIKFKKEEKKPTWEAYQVLWTEDVKTTRKNCPSWELGLCQMKITECRPTITTSHAIENGMTIQNNKASGTTNYVSFVENSYLMKECGTTFLVKKEHEQTTWNLQNPYSNTIVMGWSNKLMDSKEEQDCRVMEIIKGEFNFKEQIE
ncbi:hypothetical protein G9A89_017801 [Geosiphon pyriformis]|nr:hypothetical protein G9A89_017801 [Geosiphon pyriformis]